MIYPVAITMPANGVDYLVSVADIPGCQTTAATLDMALTKIHEVMAGHLSLLAEYGEAIPKAKSLQQHQALQADKEVVWAVIDFDITPYLGKSHKINVTLPELLIKQIDEQVSRQPQYRSRSGFIATACLRELQSEGKK